MKKLYISIGALLVGAGTVFAVQQALPTRTMIQEKVYLHALQDKQEAFEEKQEANKEYEEKANNELEEFCLLVRLKRADGISLEEETSITRYQKECNDPLSKVPPRQ